MASPSGISGACILRLMTGEPSTVYELVEKLEGIYGRPDPTPRLAPMDELISCILSQHAADAVSYPTFFAMKEIYPTWDVLAKETPERLAVVIKRAGLANQKARSILGCLAGIKSRTGGYSLALLEEMSTPEALKWLQSLPGVGPKTASITLCFAFRRPVVPVDTHVYRLSVRLGLVPEGTGESKAHGVLDKIVPGDLAFRYHMALVHHGRGLCPARKPQCRSCPVASLCAFAAARKVGA